MPRTIKQRTVIIAWLIIRASSTASWFSHENPARPFRPHLRLPVRVGADPLMRLTDLVILAILIAVAVAIFELGPS
jgi:hypothetical protein